MPDEGSRLGPRTVVTPERALAEAVVDLGAIEANVRTIRAVSATPLLAVVKANGFGHGAFEVARAALAAGATWLGVTSAAEALALRTAGITAPVLSWLHRPDDDFASLIAASVDIAVSTGPHLDAVARAARTLGAPAVVQLKADTGLSRNGAVGADWADLTAAARRYEVEGTLRVRGVWSHLINAEIPGCPTIANQTAAFTDAVRAARRAGLDPALLHLANSAAALTAADTRFDLCRIGIALYGVHPSHSTRAAAVILRPAMTLRTSVVNVKRVPAGTSVSYGLHHVTDRPTTLALLPVGFGDGLPRTAEGRAAVQLAGERCPIVGRIAMDQCVADVGDLPVALGDPVVIFGVDDGASPDAAPMVTDWARWAGTSPHEILTGIGARVARRYVNTEATIA